MRSGLPCLHLTVLWTERCPGQVEPFACGMNRIAAIAASTFDRTRVLSCASAVAAGTSRQPKSAVGQWPCCLQYWPHGLLESGPGRSCRHLSDQADTPGNSPELFSVARRHADRSMY